MLPTMRVCCLLGGVCCLLLECAPLAVDRQTSVKNTFPELHWRVVIMQNIFTPNTSKSGSIFLKYNDSTELSIDLKYI